MPAVQYNSQTVCLRSVSDPSRYTVLPGSLHSCAPAAVHSNIHRISTITDNNIQLKTPQKLRHVRQITKTGISVQ
jgi:hypothetical protein